MDQTVFATIFQWVVAHGYWFMLGLMMIEGPMVTTVASFAASWGYFNPVFVYLLAIVGDVVPDIAYYYFGFGANFALTKGFRGHWRLPVAWQEKIEKFLSNNTVKTVVFVKLTPFLPFPGLAFMGSRRVNFWKVIITCTWITAIKDLIFVLIGYTLGQVFNLNTYLKYGNWVLPALLVVFIILYFIYRLFFALLSKKLDRP
jgi:membrane protein DedA with SNARE-associated domain